MRRNPNVPTAALAIATALAWVSVPAHAQDTAVMARAASVAGRVLISTANGSPAFALTSGYILNPGDKVDTRGGGHLMIDLSDGSVILVQPETVLLIKDYRAAESLRELFQITIGVVRVKINHFVGRPNPYRMNSPTASIAVRGTEFSIIVDQQGATKVEVYEGAVEVSSRDDPNQKTLVEQGSGVLVRPGQDLLLYFTSDRGQHSAPPGNSTGKGGPDHPANAPSAVPPGPDAAHDHPPKSDPGPFSDPHKPMGNSDDARLSILDLQNLRSNVSLYDRYLSGLTALDQVPFANRYGAFAESYLDTFENPAYATEFRRSEGRMMMLPTLRGSSAVGSDNTALAASGNRDADYSFSPQFAMFTPLGGGRFVVGASASASRIGDSGSTLLSGGTSTGTFASASLIAAVRLGDAGRTSLGVSLERLRGSGGSNIFSLSSDPVPTDQTWSASSISQTRFTIGLTQQLPRHHTLGLFFRYGRMTASDVDQLHLFNGQPLLPESTWSSGHTVEAGVRLRGTLTPKLFYGVSTSWMGLSMRDELARLVMPDSRRHDSLDRGIASLSFGYLLSRRTILSFDLVGALSHGSASSWEAYTAQMLDIGRITLGSLSTHVALQRDLSRKLFISGSLLSICRSSAPNLLLGPDSSGQLLGNMFQYSTLEAGKRFSDYAAGWRFTPSFTLQYIYSTDYGATSGSHALLARYTFHLRGE